MKKENLENKPSLQEEITSLKRQVAGAKGRNKQLAEENRALKDCLSEDKEQRKKLVDGLESQVTKLSNSCTELKKELNEKEQVLNTYRDNVAWFNNLPWYKKMFVKM